MKIAEAALAKWAAQDLAITDDGDNRLRCRFLYEGSTCCNMGWTFSADLICVIEEREGRHMIESASVLLPMDSPAVKGLCMFQRGKRNLDTINDLTQDLVVGRWLDDFLGEEHDVNPAGCVCGQSELCHKWVVALSTLAYALEHDLSAAA